MSAREVIDATLIWIEKNRILSLVNEHGPPACQFQWSEKEQQEWSGGFPGLYRASMLTHQPTGYYCIFGAHEITISPGWKTKVQDFRHEDKRERKEDLCAKWLVIVKLEAETPDLWATITQEAVLSHAVSSASLDNRPFTAAEQSLIAEKLDEIKAFVVEGQQFAAEQAEIVERHFAYQREASVRLGRKDWLNSFLGNMMSLVIGLMLDPAKAKGILRLAGEAFQSLWGMAARYLQ